MDAARAAVTLVEQRARARLRARLTLAVLAASAVAVAAIVYGQQVVADRAAAEAQRAVDDAAREAKVAQERAAAGEVAKAAVEQMYRDLDGGRWLDARSSLARASDQLKGHSDWPADLTHTVRQAETDLAISTEFDAVRHSMADFSLPDGGFDNAARGRVYQEAFAKFGYTDWADTDGVAARIAASRIRAVLDDGLGQFSFTPDPVLRPAVQAIVDKLHAGSDPWRVRWEEARRSNQPAVLALADDPDTYRRLPAEIIGLAYSIEDRAKRVAVLRRGQFAHPLDYWLYNNLVTELSAGTRDERWDAVGYARTASALRPQSVRAALKLAQALAAVERHDEAFSVARRAIELSNDEGTTRAEYAQLLNRAGKPTEAEAEFRRAIEATPPSGYAHDKFGHFLQDRGRNPEAIPLFREAAKLESASCRYHSCLATALDIAKDNAGAAVVYGQLAANRPTDSRWRLFQASHLTRAGDPKQALELVQAVLQKEAGNPTAWVQLGNARYALKDLGGAADAYLRAVELAPSDRRLHAHVAPRLLAADRPADLVAVMTKNLKQSADWLNQDDDHLLYNGACAAVLAARSAADPKEQTAFRLLGRVWTRAYLAWWKKKLAGTAADRESLAASLTNWLSDPDFNSVRPGIQRIAIPPAERAEWDALWADGRATLTAARTPPPRKE